MSNTHTSPLATVDALSAMANPFGARTNDDDQLFAQAMSECDDWHRSHNSAYAKLSEGIAREGRPNIPVGLFKQVDLGTPVSAAGTWLSSSGSSNQGKTRVFFDEPSIERIKRSMFQMFMHSRFVDLAPANFLLLSPDPKNANAVGYATAFDKFTACAPHKELVYAVSAAGDFLPEVAWDALTRWSADKSTIFVFGLTVFFERLALAGGELAPKTTGATGEGGPLKVLTGGGWKGFAQELSRPEMIEQFRSLVPNRQVEVRDLFGLTEHPLHYLSCALGRFHIPKYSRFEIVDSEGKSCSTGVPGLIRLRNPFFASLPSHDLLTEDMGQWGSDCPCGAALPYFEFLKRATSGSGTCAHSASSSAAP